MRGVNWDEVGGVKCSFVPEGKAEGSQTAVKGNYFTVTERKKRKEHPSVAHSFA